MNTQLKDASVQYKNHIMMEFDVLLASYQITGTLLPILAKVAQQDHTSILQLVHALNAHQELFMMPTDLSALLKQALQQLAMLVANTMIKVLSNASVPHRLHISMVLSVFHVILLHFGKVYLVVA